MDETKNLKLEIKLFNESLDKLNGSTYRCWLFQINNWRMNAETLNVTSIKWENKRITLEIKFKNLNLRMKWQRWLGQGTKNTKKNVLV